MNRWLWELQRARWRLGNFGLLALVLLAVAVSVVLMEILPLRRDLEARRHELDARGLKVSQPPAPKPDEALSPVSADQRFYIFLHSFHAIAAKSGLNIPQITYQIAAQNETSVRRYLVEGTFATDYAQLRGFVVELRHLNGVRIERIAITRPNIGATQLEVRLQCSFLVEVAS